MIVITTIDALPECCYECPCHDSESGYCQADKANRYSDYRPFWCPLKEQKAVKPVKQIEENEWTVCGHCREHLISKWTFCPYCGNEVKWE